MPTLREMSDQLWRGEVTTYQSTHHPFSAMNHLEEVAPGLAFYKGFSNLTGLRTTDGLVLIDTGSFHPIAQERTFERIRSWNADRLHTAIYTHGHVDHAYGLPPFLAEAKAKGWAPPTIVAQRNVVPRMDRYIATAGYNTIINARQFGYLVEWPTQPIYPTMTYDKKMHLRVGGVELQLRHGLGETDDHTWVYIPQKRALCTGDFFIWSVPNCGNPQKVQRYCIDWAEALREMAAVNAEILLPGHGVPIFGADRIREALTDTAEYLESIYGQTLALINKGIAIDEIIRDVKAPPGLAAKPYLQPVYDEPEFIVRNIYRLLAGWYDGVPCELKPATLAEQSAEIASLAGGVQKLLARSKELAAAGNVRLACHLLDWAGQADPSDKSIQRARAEIYARRTKEEPSTMAKGIFGAAAREAAERS